MMRQIQSTPTWQTCLPHESSPGKRQSFFAQIADRRTEKPGAVWQYEQSHVTKPQPTDLYCFRERDHTSIYINLSASSGACIHDSVVHKCHLPLVRQAQPGS